MEFLFYYTPFSSDRQVFSPICIGSLIFQLGVVSMFRLLQKQSLRDGLTAMALLTATAALVAAPQQAMEGAKAGLALCGNVIVPSLFPFFVLSSLVVDLGLAARLGRRMEGMMRPLFRVGGGCAAAVALGFVGGYPVGARTALQLYRQGQCSREEAQRLLAFCNNSGPAFILGVVGAGIFGSGTVGLLLYFTHAVASLLVGLLFRFSGGKSPPSAARHPPPILRTVHLSTAFTDAVAAALRSTLSICSFVVFFSVALQLLTCFGILNQVASLLSLLGLGPEWAKRLVAGLLELSSGVSTLSGSGRGEISMAAFMLGWAGLSVHCQVLSFLGESGLSIRTYLLGKLCHGLIAAFLTAALTRMLPLSEPASFYLNQQSNALASLDFLSSFSLSLAGVCLLVIFWLLGMGKNCGRSSGHGV